MKIELEYGNKPVTKIILLTLSKINLQSSVIANGDLRVSVTAMDP